jgi:hypothetical protein
MNIGMVQLMLMQIPVSSLSLAGLPGKNKIMESRQLSGHHKLNKAIILSHHLITG